MNQKIYILHGWAYDSSKWKPFLDAVNEYGIAGTLLNIPGLTAACDRPWTIEDYVRWLDSTVSKERKKVTLVGHSNGGRIALWYAATHPKRVSRLILIDSAGVFHGGILSRFKRTVFRTIAHTGKKLTGSAALRRLLYRLARARDYNEASEVMKQTMVNLLAQDRVLPLEQISVPTILIWGKEDRITPLSDARELKRRLPHATLHTIDGARHAPQFSHPELIAALIKESVSV